MSSELENINKSLAPVIFDFSSQEASFKTARMIMVAGCAPKGMNKVEEVMIAIQAGYEIGLSPLQAVQSVMVINNRPTIWGDAALAICSAHSGFDIKEYFDNSDPGNLTAVCEARREGRTPVIRKFSVLDAKNAGLLDKSGPWRQYRDRMLQMRARGFALRDMAPDWLKGLIFAEEARDYNVNGVKGEIDITNHSSVVPNVERISEVEPESVLEIDDVTNKLIDLISRHKIEPKKVNEWISKAGASDLYSLSEDIKLKIINYIESKVSQKEAA